MLPQEVTKCLPRKDIIKVNNNNSLPTVREICLKLNFSCIENQSSDVLLCIHYYPSAKFDHRSNDFIVESRIVTSLIPNHRYLSLSNFKLLVSNGTKYSRMDEVKFVEDSL